MMEGEDSWAAASAHVVIAGAGCDDGATEPLHQRHNPSRKIAASMMRRRRTPWLPLAAIHSLLQLPSSSSLSPLPRCERREFLASAATVTAPTALVVPFVPPPGPADALNSVEAEARYDEYASSYDALDGGSWSRALGIDEARRRLACLASGRVLEVGAGTGLNLRHYDPAQLTSLTVVDVSDGMLARAKARAAGLDNLREIPFEAFKADATADLVRLFGEGSFDAVVDTFSLCVMGDDGARRCLDQMTRVAKRDGGRVLLLENARASNPLLGMYQDATAEAAAGAGGKGCVYNQDVSELIRSSGGLVIEREELYAAGLFRNYVCRPKIGTGA